MGQILTRLDDHLHARLKRRARAENRSMNDFVVQAIRNELQRQASTPRERVHARAEVLGMLARPGGWVPPPEVPSHDEIAALFRGQSEAFIEGLEWARGPKP